MLPLGVTVSVAASWSSCVGSSSPGVESGSNWSAAVTCALLVTSPATAVTTSMVSVRVRPSGMSPTVQVPDTGSYEPTPALWAS